MTDKIEFTPAELRDFAKRCASLGKDAAVKQLRIQQGHTDALKMDSLGYMIGVAITAFETEFDAVVDDPIQALWRQELSQSLPLISASRQLFLEENRS